MKIWSSKSMNLSFITGLCEIFMDASAANLYKPLAYTHESNYIDYERLKGKELEDVLYNSRYGGWRSPLIVQIL
jgi:hypothetical protein